METVDLINALRRMAPETGGLPCLGSGMSTAAVSTAVLSSKRRRTGWKNATEVLGAIVSR